MTNVIDSALLKESQDASKPTFLYSTPEGFEDRDEDTIHTELVAQLINAAPFVKLFEDKALVHTSDDCDSHPDCPQCLDRRARHYVRLLLHVDGRRYQLDVPPNARQRFIALAREIGDDGAPVIQLTTTAKKSSRGMKWAHVEFSLVSKEAA